MATDPIKRVEMQVDMIRGAEGYDPTDAPVTPATPEQQAALDKVPDDAPSDEEPTQN